jgi:phage terminase small subunit
MTEPLLPSSRPLNDKQRAFAREYGVDRNATQAAIRAGYSKQTAYAQGQRLLKHAEVRRFVDAEANRIAQRVDLTKERLVAELWDAFLDAKAKDQKAAMTRLGELLAKMHGWGTQNHTVRVIRSLADLTDAELQAILDSPEDDNVRH